MCKKAILMHTVSVKYLINKYLQTKTALSDTSTITCNHMYQTALYSITNYYAYIILYRIKPFAVKQENAFTANVLYTGDYLIVFFMGSCFHPPCLPQSLHHFIDMCHIYKYIIT